VLGAILLTGLFGGAMANAPACRQPDLQPLPVRLLSRPVDLGRLFLRDEARTKPSSRFAAEEAVRR